MTDLKSKISNLKSIGLCGSIFLLRILISARPTWRSGPATTWSAGSTRPAASSAGATRTAGTEAAGAAVAHFLELFLLIGCQNLFQLGVHIFLKVSHLFLLLGCEL